MAADRFLCEKFFLWRSRSCLCVDKKSCSLITKQIFDVKLYTRFKWSTLYKCTYMDESLHSMTDKQTTQMN